MSEVDFEIAAGLRAKKLRVRAPPEARVEPDSDDTELDRREGRTRLPSELQPGASYKDVSVEKQVLGRLVKPK
jgi:hypothetical protein